MDNYDKLIMSLDKFDVDFESHKFWSKFPFMEKYVDTAQFKNTPVLTVSLRENLSTTWFQKSPKRTRTYVLRQRRLGLDEPLDAGGLGTNIRTIFADSDIFEDNMEVLLNRFVSPLSSSLATSYYKYYISDTLMVDGVECIDLTFVPFNSESFSFTGHLYVVPFRRSGIHAGRCHAGRRPRDRTRIRTASLGQRKQALRGRLLRRLLRRYPPPLRFHAPERTLPRHRTGQIVIRASPGTAQPPTLPAGGCCICNGVAPRGR